MFDIKRAVAALVLCAALAVSAAACSSDKADAGGSSDSWSIPDKDPTATVKVISILDLKRDFMQEVVDAFEKEHPTITIDWEMVPFDQLNSVLDARISGKTGDPDVFWADQPRIPALSARGYTADLTAQFGPFMDQWDKVAGESSSFDGKLWAVPIANSTQLLFYNKDALKKAGVDEPSDDPNNRITWEELAQDAARIKAANAAQYPMFFGQPDRYYQLEPLPVSLGGSIGAAGDGNLTPDISGDAWIKAMEYYGKLFADGVAPRGVKSEQADPDFLAGKTAFMVEGSWLVDQLAAQDKVNWGVAAHPVFEGGKAATPTGSWSIAMNPFSKNKEAAAIFLKWMSVDNGGGYGKYRRSPELPANLEGKKAYLQREVFTTPEGKKAASLIDFETANTAVARVQTVGFVEFEDILGRAYADIRNGIDPKQALDKASGELKTAWAAYR